MKDVAEQIERFVAQQASLLDALERQVGTPLGRTVEMISTGPKTGAVRPDVRSWNFVRHGRGYRFTSEDGVVVDAHRRVELRDAVDAWRLSQFIDSTGERIEETSEREVEEVLADFERSGTLERTDTAGLYRLPRSRRGHAV